MQAKRTQAGVTLIELMIVMMIVAILAAIAYPSYQAHVRKTRRAEGQALIMDASNRQERFFGDNNAFTTNMTLLGYANPADSENGYYRLTAAAGPSGSINTSYALTVTAQGAQADDTDCATLTYDSTAQKGSTGGGSCW